MNSSILDIFQALLLSPAASQRTLARETGYSLGLVNRALQELSRDGYLEEGRPSSRALQLAQRAAPRRAVILAAGPGIHMVPINAETPKALLRVHGEVLIERLIRQLHEAGVEEIHVVVGYLKEQLEYLTEDFGVKLLVAPDYASKNNLHSLRRAADYLEDAYILPCDLWFAENPFRRTELYSWYMVTDRPDPRSALRVRRRHELRLAAEDEDGNTTVGVCYLTAEDAGPLRTRLDALCRLPRHDGDFWEAALPVGRRIPIAARVVPAESVAEINTYEQLREIDSSAEQLHTKAIDVICGALSAAPDEITQIRVLKKGMTNRSFLFRCRGRRYIMRIPGEGTQQLINRREEADVYTALAGRGISDDVLYMNPENGYKISAFLENARGCDPFCEQDVRRCMTHLRAFHEQKLTVGHTFDLFGRIDFYRSLWNGAPSAYRDYEETYAHVQSLRPFLQAHALPPVLSHIDAVYDNFLFIPGDGGETLRLIDWEYAGMHDPHIDIAMFCIYAFYDREQVDRLIDLYFPEGCADAVRVKIYGYIAACGLLWSNWCEYKRMLGVEFGEYSLRQYQYAKEYYQIVCRERKRLGL